MSDQTAEGGGGRKGPSLGVVVPLPTQRGLNDAHKAQLTASGLTEETISLSGVYTETHPARLADMMGWKRWPSSAGAALVFPFFNPGSDGVITYRVRPDYPRKDKRGKSVKYDQAANTPAAVYFPPRARSIGWLGDAGKPLLWTEGEKKALALDQLGYATIGLTGVWNWIDSAGRAEHGDRLLPLISEHAVIAGRSHVIVFDADAHSNNEVMRAAGRLAGVLTAAGALSVRFATPPDASDAKGIDDYLAKHGETLTHAVIGAAAPIEPADPKQPLQRVRRLHALREVEAIPEALRMPADYDVRKDGSLWRHGEGKRGDDKVTHAPPFITRALVDVSSGEHRVELTYAANDNGWQTVMVSRKAIADARTLVSELAPIGGPVTSQSAGKLVEWLSEFEAVNVNAIERVDCLGSAGWHSVGGESVFVAGDVIRGEGSKLTVAVDTRGERARLFAALKPKGSDVDAHRAALRAAWEADPRCAAVICAAFAAPMLRKLGQPNFAIHLPGPSSRGKTSMLKCAASVYGNPSSAAWVASWNVSQAAAEIRASTLTDLPQCYDEVGSSDPEIVERMIYDLCNGTSRSRATRDFFVRESRSWHTIILSTGERELVDEDAATGAQVRVVQLPVSGFGELKADEVDALREACAAHAGVIGRDWLGMLVGFDDADWSARRDVLTSHTASLRQSAADSLQGRVAAYYALLAVTESMLADVYQLGDSNGETMRQLYLKTDTRDGVLDIGERARDLVEQWVWSSPDAFPEVEAITHDQSSEPKRSTVTRHGVRRSDGRVLIIPHELRQFLKRNRLPPKEVLRDWTARGWVERGDGRHVGRKHQLGTGNYVERQRFIDLRPRSQSEGDE